MRAQPAMHPQRLLVWAIISLFCPWHRARATLPLRFESELPKHRPWYRRLVGDTQDFPTCHDSGLWCYDVAKPQVVEGFWSDSSLDVWSDNGWCNLGDQASKSIKMACPRSCGVCSVECINELDLLQGEGSCAALLAAYPEACKICDSADPSCDEDRAVYVQSWCLKTCYESGDLPYARPCYDPCTFEEHPCTFPFTFEGAAFEVCLSLEKKDGRRPPRASEHGTPEDEATVQWCGVKTELLQGDFQGLDWAYCSCAAVRASTTATSSPTTSVISTTTPTASASTINIVAACPETSGRLSAAMAEQCSQFMIRQECTLDLSSLRGPLTCNQAAISVPAHFSLHLVDSQQDLVLTCGDGNNDLDDTYLFYLHENASLVLDGVSVTNCSGAVYQGTYSHFEIQNASISGNQNLAGPAGVFWGGSFATTRVLRAVISNNIGASAGVFSNANGVGSLDVVFQDSLFENNTAMEAGGIVALSSEPRTVAGGRLWVESCTFRRNVAATRGGLLSVGRGLLSLRATFFGCYFEDHRAFEGGLFYFGDSGVNYELLDLSRAERLVRLIVRKSFVRTALAHVGAFVSQIYDGNTAVIVDQTSLTAARVTNHGALVAITSRPSSLNLDGANQNIFALAMSDSQIFENVADVDGGVLSIRGPARVLISNSSFTDNHAKSGGGGVLLAAGAPGMSLSMISSRFVNNSALSNGGALLMTTEANMTMTDSTFHANVAVSGSGGAIFSSPIEHATSGNLQLGLHLEGVNTFTNNQARRCGGALCFARNTRCVSLGTLVLVENQAVEGEGGAICLDEGAELITDNLNCTKNQALSRAGALRVRSGASLAVNGSARFIQNTARSHGGAMALDLGSRIALSGISEFKANRILGSDAGAGGAIAVVPGAGHLLAVNISNASFVGNHALAAPLIYVDLVADLRLVSEANDWALVAGNNGVFNLQNVSFDKAIHAKPITTAPAALKACPAQLDDNDDDNDQLTCAFQTETIASLSTHSGGFLPSFCVVLVDAFDEPFATPRELVLPLVIQTPVALKTSVHLPEPFAGTLALQDSLLIRGIRIVAATGNYTLHLQPKLHSQHFTSKRRIASAKLPVFVDHCPSGDILVPYAQTRLKVCTSSASRTIPGWYFPDSSNISRSEQCPRGTCRPGSWPATQCYACLPGSISTLTRDSCTRCEGPAFVSWNSSDEACSECPEGARCLGGVIAIPAQRFFHTFARSGAFLPCISRSACTFAGRSHLLAEQLREVANWTTEALLADTDFIRMYRTLQCASGYAGMLCGECTASHWRGSLTGCTACATLQTHAGLSVLGVILASFFMCVCTQLTPFSASDDVFKIVLGFLQQISVLRAFRAEWAIPVMWASSLATSATSGTLTWAPCILEDSFVPSFMIEAVLLVYVFPLLMVVLVSKISRGGFCRAKTSLWKSTRTVTRFLYPQIAVGLTRLFVCTDSKDWSARLVLDTSQECWTAGSWHFAAMMGIAAPFGAFLCGVLIVWGSRCLYFWLCLNAACTQITFATFVESAEARRHRFWDAAAALRVFALIFTGTFVASPTAQCLISQGNILLYMLATFCVRPFKYRKIMFMDQLASTFMLLFFYMEMSQHLLVDSSQAQNWDSFGGVLVGLLLCLAVVAFVAFVVVVAVSPLQCVAVAPGMFGGAASNWAVLMSMAPLLEQFVLAGTKRVKESVLRVMASMGRMCSREKPLRPIASPQESLTTEAAHESLVSS